MRPQYHLLSSIIFGSSLYIITLDKSLSLSAGITSFFIDLDHLLIFWRSHPQHPLSLRQFLNCRVYIQKIKRLYLVFHSWELVCVFIVLGLVFNASLFLGIGLGILLHLFLDQIGNAVYKGSYFFLWRLHKDFKTDKILRKISS